MEFPFYISKALPLDSNGFAILDAASPSTRTTTLNTNTYTRGVPLNSQDSKANLMQIIDKMGEASSRAQGLGAIITSYSKFQFSGDQRLYIKVEENKVCGILKTGKKNLFYTDGFGGFKEIKPLCVLDFYVHESLQRKGVGKELFEKMLLNEGVGPHNLAYDRPSIKFISFLKKHYGLSSYIPQNNNFVIFQQYFEDTKKRITEQKKKNNGSEFGSIQDSRNQTFNANKMDYQKVEKNIPENDVSKKLNQAYQGYPTQQAPPKYLDRFESKNNMYSASQQSIKQEPTFKDVEAQMKAADQAFEKQKGQTNSENMGKGKTQIWNVSYDKPQVSYSTKTPWGSYGPNVDSFKSSSSAYGSYYSHNRTGSKNK